MAVKPDIAKTSRDWARREPFLSTAFAAVDHAAGALAFVDPGVSAVSIDDIGDLVHGGHAVIVVHTPAIMRILGEIVRRRSKREPAELLAPIVPVEVAPAFAGRVDSASSADEIASAFAQALAECVGDGVEECLAEVAPDSPLLAERYHVLFVTREPAAIVAMNDALVREQREGGHQVALDFADTSTTAQAWDEFRDSLFAIEQDHPGVAWKHADLVRESVRRRFGERSSTDHARAIAQLLSRTYGDRIRPAGGMRRGGAWQIHEWTRLEFVTQETETVNVDAPEEEPVYEPG
jgi:hypothetical protein